MSALRSVAAAMMIAVGIVAPASAKEPVEGVKIGRMSIMRNLVSEEKLEHQASLQYDALTRKAFQQQALLGDNHAITKRVRKIANDLLPHATKFNERAKTWKWEINVINSPTINAFCMPGGKIVVFTGIIDKLQMTDDEIALVVGHEIAHALREHSRARAAKSTITNVGAIAAGLLIGGNVGQLAQVGGDLLGRRFSRTDETEADLVGMELAARAAYDPRAGVRLWEKMSAASKGAPPQWLSTHPSGATRIQTFKDNIKDVLPLYERAKAGG
ncbi:MAG: M48 family metallopeptidase [Hyphomicrobiaceae bacterium]